ncbi:17141_t:CDS:2 [Funneliformis geosporum]|uniref:17141_t:CDS:1 n=1 Tax=Funneliformis geosporum TaxID=1117311 RepID=A0A9W4STZ5_9GLOM|nr:17141_t:CDS:2 [Funneliformis geosporum]
MKSPIIIATVIGLIMLKLIEVWIQNRALSGTITCAAATHENEGDKFSFNELNDAIDEVCKTSHDGYYLNISDTIQKYWLIFGVEWSTEDYKWRGPFTNNGDKCWHFHGIEDNWDVYPCPPSGQNDYS